MKITDENGGVMINNIYKKPLNHEAIWRKGTTLIAGDSMLNGVDETKLRNTKSVFSLVLQSKI